MSEVQAEKAQPPKWEEFMATVNFRTTGPPFDPIWIIKLADGRYVRCITSGGFLGCSKRMATRFDSRTWAGTLMQAINPEAKPRLVRLVTKAEKDARQAPKAWRYRAPEPLEVPLPPGIQFAAETTPADTSSGLPEGGQRT